MAFCIPKHIALKLRKAAEKKEFDIQGLYGMTSLERRAVFQKYVNQPTAVAINAGFEGAIVSSRKNAIAKWVQDTFLGEAAKKKTTVFSHIVKLKDIGLLTPEGEGQFLNDLVAIKLGVEVKPDEAKEIARRSDILEEEFNKPKDKFGLPPVSYFKARKEMEDYLKSLNPTHGLKIGTSVIARGTMLFSLKSPITNIIGNSVQAIEQSFERRIMSRMYQGVVDKALIKEYLKKSDEIYNAGHFDLSRAEGYEAKPRVLGEMITHSQGKGVVRKVGRFYEDIIFNQTQGRPDVIFARHIFVDAINLFATKLLKDQGITGDELKQKANRIFMDAASPSATTPEGMLVREQAIAEALFGTFQNDSIVSEVSLGVRELINKATGDLMLGDQIMPFVKTKANVAAMSLDAAGFGFIRGTAGLFKGAIKEFHDGNPSPLREVLRAYLRAGMGILAAFLLSMLIPIDDFVGLYPTNKSEQELLKAKKGNGNMVRIGGRWISLDYFGFLGAPLVGLLYARKYGKNMPESMLAYATGALIQFSTIPGVTESRDLVSLILSLRPDQLDSVSTIAQKQFIGLLDGIRARIVPGFSGDLAKAFDDTEREVDPNSITDKIKATIPFLRNTLPAKKDVFGTVIKGEPWWTAVLFGARVQTARQNRVIDEMTRLNEAGQLPTLTRPDLTSSRVKALKEQIGVVKYALALDYFRSKYYADIDKTIASNTYKRLGDEDKKNALDKIKDDDLNTMLTKYHYKKPKAK